MAQYKRLWPNAREFKGWIPGLVATIIFAIIARNLDAWVKVMGKTSGGFWEALHQSGFAKIGRASCRERG